MKYKVTALTPVLVGDGRELAPIDYMVWKDHVNVLDQARIFRLLARGPRLEGYLGQLRKATKLDFASWGGFAQNFSQRRIPFEHAESSSIWNAAQTESLFIPTFAADHRGAYLPASALKGALRTGLVFSRWSAATIEKAAASIEGDRMSRRIAEAAESASGASQVKILSMADSQVVPTSAFKVYLTRVATLDTRGGSSARLAWKIAGRGSIAPQQIGQSTPLFVEMAVPGTSFLGACDERNFLERSEFQRAFGWRSKPEVATIIEAANKYAAAQLESHAQYAETAGLTGLGHAVARLQGELANLDKSACLLCLGWGGGFTSKAGVLDADNPAYIKILRTVPAIGRSFREGVRFPKTRRIVFIGGQPTALPGWVRLQLEN